MKFLERIAVNANTAVAMMAYKTNEIFPIYPITPASPMAELVEEWSAKQQKNSFGNVPMAFEMQSEAGVAGTMHGAIQTGALSTSFTASQGLLLMLPNMYKIAGELTPNVIHVATRAIATHALSIFGDHSDVMAVRQSGYALLASASVQEALDFALIAQMATLKSRVPFVHFFDGFRTSHETQIIENITDETIWSLMDSSAIAQHRKRALNPENPVIRGTSQTPATFFQSREAVNEVYEQCPEIVAESMRQFAKETGRSYRPFEYVGHPHAERVIIVMASAAETVESTVAKLNKRGEKVGMVKVRLYRPFSRKFLLEVLPKTCAKIAVLDRTKEPGCAGEPLFLDVSQSVFQGFQQNEITRLPKIIGGRYGLSSKEFTPAMAEVIFEHLLGDNPQSDFTVGIHDDKTKKSLVVSSACGNEKNGFEVLIFGYKNEQSKSIELQLGEILKEKQDVFAQVYTEFDFNKSKTKNITNLRFSNVHIKAPYLIEKADMVICEHLDFLRNGSVIDRIKDEGVMLLSAKLLKEKSSTLSIEVQQKIKAKQIKFFTTNNDLATGIDLAFYYFLMNKNDFETHAAMLGLRQVDPLCLIHGTNAHQEARVPSTFLDNLLSGKGKAIPVSEFPIDGTYPSGTSKYLGNRNKGWLPDWNMDACTQCGLCSLHCPQAAIRPKVFSEEFIPEDFNLKYKIAEGLGKPFDLLNYTLQVNPDQCNSCNLCVEACEDGALELVKTSKILELERNNWLSFKAVPDVDRSIVNRKDIAQQQLLEPLFQYSLGEDGCGQAPYLKALSQLFGDRMLVANATGASSIYGGAMPVTPWSKTKEGRGPAWSNSLFEDNAEFGLGFQLSQQQLYRQAKELLQSFRGKINGLLIDGILNANLTSENDVRGQRRRVVQVKEQLNQIAGPRAKKLLEIADYLVKKSVWIVGGDGWAYDIGYGGLDHVLATGENVNILVLDNELYSNTGGQQSKATPKGATAKFGYSGKTKKKKNLGALAMQYEDVYVASVALGANPQQVLDAFEEAESYEGPSLVIAYCHSPEHGMDKRNPIRHQKAAVASGHWQLYRYDPRKGLSFEERYQSDSDLPTMPIKDFFQMESRFEKTLKYRPELVDEIQRDIDRTVSHKLKSNLETTL